MLEKIKWVTSPKPPTGNSERNTKTSLLRGKLHWDTRVEKESGAIGKEKWKKRNGRHYNIEGTRKNKQVETYIRPLAHGHCPSQNCSSLLHCGS